MYSTGCSKHPAAKGTSTTLSFSWWSSQACNWATGLSARAQEQARTSVSLPQHYQSGRARLSSETLVPTSTSHARHRVPARNRRERTHPAGACHSPRRTRRRRPRSVPAPSHGVTPPRAVPPATARRAHLRVAPSPAGEHRPEKQEKDPRNPRRGENYFLVQEFFRVTQCDPTGGLAGGCFPGLGTPFSHHAPVLGLVALPSIPLSSGMVVFLKRPRPNCEKVEEGTGAGRVLGGVRRRRKCAAPFSDSHFPERAS